jgi:predicted phage terminase large subunit-like protein
MLTQAQRTDRIIAMALEVFGGAAQEREPLLDFIPKTTPRIAGRVTVRPEHLKRLIDVLQRAHREPLRVLVSVPPRHAKTETVLHAIAWILRDDPSALLAYIGYGADFARSKSRSARDYAVKASVVLREDANALHEWLTPQGGGLRSGGIGGPLNGLGFRVIVVDDPIKNRQDAESGLIRQRNWDWFTSTAMTRLEPSGSMIVVHTRWHEDDLIGRCLKEREKYDETNGVEGEPWVHINLQAIDDESGEALWPEVWPLDKLLRKKASVGEYDWASLYQGQPRPRGSKVFQEPTRYEGSPSTAGKRIVIGVDVAGTAKTTANFTVALVFACSGYGDTMTADIIDGIRIQATIPDVCRQLEKLQAQYSGAPLVVENAGIGKAVPQVLRDVNPKLRIVEVEPKGDKFTRAQPYAAAWNAGRIRLPKTSSWAPPVVRTHTDFTGVNDACDDDVDAGGHAWNYAQRMIQAPAKPPPPLRTYNLDSQPLGF